MDFAELSDILIEHLPEVFGGVSIPIVVLFLCKLIVGMILTKIEAKAKLKANTGLVEKLDITMGELNKLDEKYKDVFKEYLKETEQVCINGFKQALEDYKAKQVVAYNEIMESADEELKQIEAQEIAFEQKLQEAKEEMVEELNKTIENIENNMPKIDETNNIEEEVEEVGTEENTGIIEVEVVRE